MIYLTDMSRCIPKSSLSKSPRKGCWRLIEYDSEAFKGVMIYAGVPDVTYPLNLKGWYAIYIGYWNPGFTGDSQVNIKIKLRSDPCFINIADNEPDGLGRTTLRETFWKYADLADEGLIFGQQKKGTTRPAYIAYVKLEPLSNKVVKRIQMDQAKKDTRVIIAANDGASFMHGKAPATKEDILEQIEPYRYSDVGRLDWAVCYGDMTNYPSKAGWKYYADKQGDFISQGSKNEMESLRTLINKGVVPYKIAMEFAHSIGIEFYAMFRMGIGSYPPPMENRGGLFAKRPDLRIIARDGTPLPKLSYAFPEVRERMLDIIREIADTDIDGINICWIRGAPYIGYEKPVAEAFKKQYGRDVKDVNDDDKRLCRIRSEYLTDFMRRTREITDHAGKRRGRKLKVTAMTSGTFTKDLYHGWDTKTWVEEKLVDDMVAALIHTQYLHANGIKEFCYVGPDGPDSYIRSVINRAESGADGFFIWDMNSVQEFSNHWSVLRGLGHTEKVLARLGNQPGTKKIKLKKVGNINVEHTYDWGNMQAMVFYTNG